MSDVRSRVAHQHGVELSNDQIQELAARKLEAILDPRGLPPALLEAMRRGAGTPPPAVAKTADAGYAFQEAALYDSPNGLLRGIRKLLRPILALFMNPAVIVEALRGQARFNAAVALREAERDRRQVEWNALHYELLQRLVTEVSRVSLEMQSLALSVESLSAKIDFNERRVRSMEQATPAARPRAAEPVVAVGPVAVDDGGAIGAGDGDAGAGEGPRRKRRRRRGRRGGAAGEAMVAGASGSASAGPSGGEQRPLLTAAEMEAAEAEVSETPLPESPVWEPDLEPLPEREPPPEPLAEAASPAAGTAPQEGEQAGAEAERDTNP